MAKMPIVILLVIFFCEKGYVEIDYTLLRTAIADNGKKFVSNNNGKPYEIVICRNGNDLEL